MDKSQKEKSNYRQKHWLQEGASVSPLSQSGNEKNLGRCWQVFIPVKNCGNSLLMFSLFFFVKETVSAEVGDKFCDSFALLKFTENERGLK